MTNLHEKIKEEKSTASTEELWTLFRDKIQTAIKDHIPHKQARVKKVSHGSALSFIASSRRETESRKCASKAEELKQQNKQLRREVQQLGRAYWNYLSKTFQENDSQQTCKSKRFCIHQTSEVIKRGSCPPKDQWPPSI